MKLQIPSKTFLWGEYSALVGGSAGILTGYPYFELQKSDDGLNSPLNQALTHDLFHPDSPAGKYLNKHLEKKITGFEFSDPYEFKGGFGRSTAEYISALVLSGFSFLDSVGVLEAWREYRSLSDSKNNPPSGYDLIAQAANTLRSYSLKNEPDNSDFKITLIESENKVDEIKLKEFESEQAVSTKLSFETPDWSVSSDLLKKIGIMVFKTSLKIKTHEHLNELDFDRLGPLKKLSQKVSESFLSLDVLDFFKSLMNFDQELEKLNLVHKDSKIICDKIKKMDSVYYARGCGALGADVIAVFYDIELDLNLKLALRQKILSASELIFIADTGGID